MVVPLVWSLAAVAVAGSIAEIALGGVVTGGSAGQVAQGVAWTLLPAVYAVTAALIVARRPRNLIGWLLMVTSLAYLSGVPVSDWLNGMPAAPGEVTVGLLAAIAWDNFNWVAMLFPVFHLLLVFPTGALLSRRWRWVVVLEIVMILTMVIFAAFLQPAAPFSGAWSVDNPVGLIPASVVDSAFFVVWTQSLVVVTVSGVTSMVLRYRRSSAVEREQIKWLLFAVAVFGVVYSIAAVLATDGEETWGTGGWMDFLVAMSLIGIAVAIGMAVLRYRLFEIDRIISRTVGYAAVVVTLGLVYAVGALWVPTLFEGERSPLLVAGSTLAVAALFNPVRRRTLRWVDRRFYRSRYDAEQVMQAFSGRLQGETDLRTLAADWVAVLRRTVQPSAVRVWVRDAVEPQAFRGEDLSKPAGRPGGRP